MLQGETSQQEGDVGGGTAGGRSGGGAIDSTSFCGPSIRPVTMENIENENMSGLRNERTRSNASVRVNGFKTYQK